MKLHRTQLLPRIKQPHQKDKKMPCDFIGNGDNAAYLLHIIEEHMHSESKVYPTLAAPVAVLGDNSAWTLGSFVEIVPVDTITDVFDIHFINIEDADDDDMYELVLYADETEIGRVRFVVDTSVFGGALPAIPFQTPLIPANTKIQAKVASSAGGGDTVNISIHYHTY